MEGKNGEDSHCSARRKIVLLTGIDIRGHGPIVEITA